MNMEQLRNMEHQNAERRKWQRLAIESEAELKNHNFINSQDHVVKVLDISGGGALLSVDTTQLNEDPMGLSILNIGNYDAVVVRQWDDKAAVVFPHDEDDQYSLQEELEIFCRENDYDD